jgi:hypothetical protein
MEDANAEPRKRLRPRGETSNAERRNGKQRKARSKSIAECGLGWAIQSSKIDVPLDIGAWDLELVGEATNPAVPIAEQYR